MAVILINIVDGFKCMNGTYLNLSLKPALSTLSISLRFCLLNLWLAVLPKMPPFLGTIVVKKIAFS